MFSGTVAVQATVKLEFDRTEMRRFWKQTFGVWIIDVPVTP